MISRSIDYQRRAMLGKNCLYMRCPDNSPNRRGRKAPVHLGLSNASRLSTAAPFLTHCPIRRKNALSSSRENTMTSDDFRFFCTNAGPMPQGESRRVFLLLGVAVLNPAQTPNCRGVFPNHGK